MIKVVIDHDLEKFTEKLNKLESEVVSIVIKNGNYEGFVNVSNPKSGKDATSKRPNSTRRKQK